MLDPSMGPTTQSRKRSIGTVQSTDPQSELATDTIFTQTAVGTVATVVSSRTSSNLDHTPLDSLDEAVIEIASRVIKAKLGRIKFQSRGKTYYGVRKQDLEDLSHNRQEAMVLASILSEVAHACEATHPQANLQQAVSLFEMAVEDAATAKCSDGCRSCMDHARRWLARLVVAYQGFYVNNDSEIATFSTVGVVGRKPAHTPIPIGIKRLYAEFDPELSPIQILTWQLSGLSEHLSKLVEELSKSVPVRPRKASKHSRSFTSKTGKSPIVQLPVAVWSLSNRAVLQGLALNCLRDDLPRDRANAMMEELTSERQSLQLPKSHRNFLKDKLLPDLDAGDVEPHHYLAVLLGYFDWVRVYSHCRKHAAPDENDGKLYEQMLERAINLQFD